MHIFGLDISDSMIRLAVLQRRGRTFRLPIRGEIPVPPGLMNDGDLLQPAAVSDLLRRLVTAAKPKTKQAIVTLPERHSFIKVITLPADTPATDETIKTNVLPHLPYNWDEMAYDWHVLPAVDAKPGTRVLFGGAPLTMVRAYLDMLRAADIEVVGMEIESVAIARAMLRPATPGAHILLDMGRTRTSLMLVNAGVVEFSTTIRYAGQDLNNYLADTLHISIDQAQKAKEMFGLDPTRGKGLLARVLAPQLDILAEKIQNIQEFYGEHFDSETPISSILLNGSGALIRNIDVELAKRMNEPVKIQPSWIVTDLVQDPHDIHDIAYTYTTALGLALQPFYNGS